jgi:hypothetical protein
LTNNSALTLTIKGFSTGGDFTKTTDTCGGSLAAGASYTINVTFAPTTGGTRTGTLTVTDSASNSPHGELLWQGKLELEVTKPILTRAA